MSSFWWMILRQKEHGLHLEEKKPWSFFSWCSNHRPQRQNARVYIIYIVFVCQSPRCEKYLHKSCFLSVFFSTQIFSGCLHIFICLHLLLARFDPNLQISMFSTTHTILYLHSFCIILRYCFLIGSSFLYFECSVY